MLCFLLTSHLWLCYNILVLKFLVGAFMQKIKKLLICALSVMFTGVALTACDLPSSLSSEDASITESVNSETVNSDEESSFIEISPEDKTSSDFSDEVSLDEVSSDENSLDETSSDEDSSDEDSSEEYSPMQLYAESVMNDAELLNVGASLVGTYELSGIVTYIDIEYTASKGICLYFDVDEPQNREMYCYQLKGTGASLIAVGDYITVSGTIKNYRGTIEFDKGCTLVSYVAGEGNQTPDVGDDPYESVSKSEFYANYTPATDSNDAYYRSLHGFMSGSLVTPDQAPTLSSYQPMDGDKYIRNSEMLLSEDGKTYTVVDAWGNAAFNVYKGGAYITLEEVAAYVYAFGTYPANYTTSKSTSPSDSVWGEYLRLNHTAFSGDTSRYPYEPVLPNITGCGGTLNYYEMDIGTTGTDCDPSYTAELYNDGYSITRGAARIVYGKRDLNGNGVYEIGEFHVFYTYNHYNDFQEYLNYEGGWGEMFGNITGGGTISSKSDYNPTDYVEVAYQALPKSTSYRLTNNYYFYDDKKLFGCIGI